ncbi:MAG: GNAT family N-acetyltransferase [Thermoplasmata archaeon]
MGPDSFRSPVTLSGRHAALLPLDPSHAEALRPRAADPEVGRYLRLPPGRSFEEMEEVIAALLDAQRAGTDLPFTTCLLPDLRPIGMTRFLRIDRDDEWVEIGGTWLDPAYWRTPVNTEAKYLLLRHAFESEQAHRVSLQTDLRNVRSQRAIERLGAVHEGVTREDVRLADGYRRSSVHYAVLVSEWPAVKSRLEAALARPWPAR